MTNLQQRLMDQTLERWLPVVGYEGFYEVSDHGRVRSLDRTIYRNYSTGPRATKLQGKVLRLQNTHNGSGQVYVSVRLGAKSTMVKVHRLLLTAFVGPCPAGMETRHLNGDPSDNRLSNLQWGTVAENTADRGRHGNFTHGERNGCAKLAAADIIEIRDSDLCKHELARRYDVRAYHIRRIQMRRRWAHL